MLRFVLVVSLFFGFGSVAYVQENCTRADLNRDGVVDFQDFLIFTRDYGKPVVPCPPDTVFVTVRDTVFMGGGPGGGGPGGGGAGENEPAADISIRGDRLFYKGDISPQSYEKFLNVVRGKENEINTLVIFSGGGDIIQGMQMGNWVFDNKVDVVVDTLCFSSCANYIFTAGRNKVIREGSIVGWHGSAQQENFLAESMGKSLDEVLREVVLEYLRSGGNNPSEAEIMAEIEALKKMNADDIAMEKEFLKKIGVPVDALVYGLTKSQYAEYVRIAQRSNANGWTLSIEDMAKLGIRNVTYQGQGSYPSPDGLRAFNVVVLEVK